MPLGKFLLPAKDTRLIKYDDRLFKVKLQCRSDGHDSGSDISQHYSEDVIHSEMKAAIRAVLAMQDELQSFRTDHFIIHPEKKYWNTASLLKFYEHGRQLTVEPYVLNLMVERIRRDTVSQRHTVSDQTNQRDQDNNKQQLREDSGSRSGLKRTSAKGDGQPEDGHNDDQHRQTRAQTRRKSTEHPQDNDSSSEIDRPRFNSPPRKHRRYLLRERAKSASPDPSRRSVRDESRRQPHDSSRQQPSGRVSKRLKDENGDSHRVRKISMLSTHDRFRMIDCSEDTVQEGGSPSRYRHATPANIEVDVGATASNTSQPAHPQGGVLQQEMLRPNPNQIEQCQLEEEMRLQRLAGPAKCNRGHPAFASPPTEDVEAPRSTIKRIIDVMLTPAKRLFSK